MTDSALLGLPYIDAAQSQKHVTHNEALALLDLLVHIAVEAVDVAAPPSNPQEGRRFHVGAGATGAFAGQDGRIAAWQDGAWRFLAPAAGWTLWLGSSNDFLIYDGAEWRSVAASIHALQNLSGLGVGTAADPSNRLAVKANAALFAALSAAEGGSGDLRVALSKTDAANTLSHVYQTGYSARAETGLIGDDHFRIKVSPDGSAWTDALDIDPATGRVHFPAGVTGADTGPGFNRLEVFNTSGTFVRQPGDVLYRVIAIGGGGGGGAGRRSAAGVQAGGGSGGNGGHIAEDWIAAANVASSSSVAVGAGGAGAPAAADSSNGANGGAGGYSMIFTLLARGGTGGAGGTATAGGAAMGTSVDAFTSSLFRCGGGGPGHASAAGTQNAASNGTAGGGGGAGISAANAAANGGVGIVGEQSSTPLAANAPGGTPASPDGASAALSPHGRFGSGGGGGASNAGGPAGNGGNGAPGGGGGGGGGGGRDGKTGGAGGAGGPGRILVYVYG